MIHDIQIGNYTLAMLASVEIKKSVDAIGWTAEITAPGVMNNRPLQINNRVKVGDRVVVKLGYDDTLVTEFEGWLQRIDTDGGVLTFNCEDDIYKTRQPVTQKVFTQAKVEQVGKYLTDTLGFKLDCSLKTSGYYFEKFTIAPNETVYNVLKALKESTAANIYMRGDTLNIHPPFIQRGGSVAYNLTRNVEKIDLKFRNASDRPLMVTVEAVGLDGKKTSETAGTVGGDTVTIKSTYPMSREAMKKQAENMLNDRSFDGYEGSLTTWMVPACEPGWSAAIIDPEFPEKNGTYYVASVITTFSDAGGAREVEISKKLSV